MPDENGDGNSTEEQEKDRKLDLVRKAKWTSDILPVDAIHKDMEYQRVCSTGRLGRMKPYSVDLALSIAVNKRPDGTYWVMDGGHRLELARTAGEELIFADVFTFPSVELEALYFEVSNRNMKPPSALQRLKARIRGKDADALALERIVHEAGYELDERRGMLPTGIQCASALEVIYRRSPEELADALALIRDTWGTAHGATHEPLVIATSMFIRRFVGRYDRKRFVGKLRQYDPDTLSHRAAQLQPLRRGNSTEKLLLEILTDLYDDKLRSGRVRPKEEE